MVKLPPTRGLVVALLLLAGGLQAQRKEFIYTEAPFPSAHASTLVELRDGRVMAAWFGGTAEGKPDVAIWSATREGEHWSPPIELAREPRVPCWNPVLFRADGGRLWLYYKFGPSVTSWTAARRYSDDEGRTWSPVEHLPAGLLGPIRAKPLLLPDGTLLAGSSVESYSSWAAWVERSDDHGQSWTSAGPITIPSLAASTAVPPIEPDGLAKPSGLIQPVIVPMGGSHLRLYARSSGDIGRICMADSADGGLHWTAAHLMDLPNPNAGIDAVRLRDGRIVLLYNDAAHARTPLVLAVSVDGEHFDNFATLESGPGEFSYPALIQGRDGDLRMTYTYNRERIRYAVYPLAKIPAAPAGSLALPAQEPR